jgi:mannitol/fructose-specific phosphotransferase system IIA component (Ntr-type)/nucleotide-binding universal stress UspA family protein
MLGDERGPETLVEIGTALSGYSRLPIMHLTEVPEQTILGGVGEQPALLSLRRRLRVMAEEEGSDLEFHSVHSRDIVRTVHSVTTRVGCDFLVMRWRGRSRWALMPYNPLGWLVDHLDCNLALFRDAGVRYIREIMVFAEPGPHDALVVSTADDLARRWGARVTLVRPIAHAAGDQKRKAEMAYLRELSELCESPSRVALIVGDDHVVSLNRESSRYDLLVMGSPQAGLLERLRGTSAERLTRKAACSVLLLKTPRVRTHEAFVKKHDAEPSKLVHYVDRGAVFAQVETGRKEALFEHIADVFSNLLHVESREILEALWARERTQNTSVGHGVALPHATLDAVSSTTVGVFTLAEPLNYHGPDGQKVDVVFVIMSPPGERQRHLELLSTIARLALTSTMLQELRQVASGDEILRVIDASELSQSSIKVNPAHDFPERTD